MRPQVEEYEHDREPTTILAVGIKQMVKDRCEEHARLKRQEKAIAARCEVLATEVDTLLAEAGMGEALLEGIAVDGHRLKLVAGETKVVNFETLIRLGCDPHWIDKATERRPRKTHVRFIHPAEE